MGDFKSTITCPWCGKQGKLPTGFQADTTACPYCGTTISLTTFIPANHSQFSRIPWRSRVLRVALPLILICVALLTAQVWYAIYQAHQQKQLNLNQA